jgi:hypothetical protein
MPGDVDKEGMQIRYATGYASLAAFIASDPDHSTAIYRRFDELSARNLLYLQSELAELKARQDELDQEDFRGDLDDKRRAKDWKVLRDRADSGDVNARERLDLVHSIRSKLKEYSMSEKSAPVEELTYSYLGEALIMESTILSLRSPAKQTFDAFLDGFNDHGNSKTPYSTLGGRSASLYDEREDLVALRRPAEEDRLTIVLRKYFPFLFMTNRQARRGRIAYYLEERIRKVVAFISMILAAGLLYGAILNLYFVTSDKAKLGLIAAYTIAFALCVGLLTNARRSEIFAASAAYAAVMVVFVSSGLGSSTRSSSTCHNPHR